MNKDRLALFGCNALGLEVARQLAARGRDFVIVDDDPGRLERAREFGYATVHVDYEDDEALRAIGIGGEIGVIFCLFDTDSDNVFLIISVRALGPDVRIISIAESPDSAEKLLAAGADKLIDPYEIAGHKIHELIRRPIIVDVLEQTIYGEHDLSIAEIEIPAGSPAAGRTLETVSRGLDPGLILLGVVDREQGDSLLLGVHRRVVRLDPGDVLVLIGHTRNINDFRREIQAGAGLGGDAPA